VNILLVTATTLSAALVIDNILNGLARPFFGWISDLIGREVTMGVVFTIGAFAYWGLGALGHTPYAFIVLAGLVFFTWGEIFSLFPAIATDTYGTTYAAANAGLLYTAKGVAVWVVPLASIIKNITGSWYWVFVFAAAMNLTVAALAFFSQANAAATYDECLIQRPRIQPAFVRAPRIRQTRTRSRRRRVIESAPARPDRRTHQDRGKPTHGQLLAVPCENTTLVDQPDGCRNKRTPIATLQMTYYDNWPTLCPVTVIFPVESCTV
jgi:MFS family permease